jgi:hypothetical protein
LSTVGIEQVFTSYDNPQGNAETDRLRRTIKDERRWLQEVRPLEAAREAIAQWITVDDTQRDGHSALGYRSPVEFDAALRAQEAAQAAAEDDSRSALDNVFRQTGSITLRLARQLKVLTTPLKYAL